MERTKTDVKQTMTMMMLYTSPIFLLSRTIAQSAFPPQLFFFSISHDNFAGGRGCLLCLLANFLTPHYMLPFYITRIYFQRKAFLRYNCSFTHSLCLVSFQVRATLFYGISMCFRTIFSDKLFPLFFATYFSEGYLRAQVAFPLVFFQ